MPKMKGGELIAQYLVQEKVPYIFGICGHGNVGILDALYQVRDKLNVMVRELSLGERMKMELIAAQLEKSGDSVERALAELTRRHLVDK